MIPTIEEALFTYIEEFDYFKGFGKYDIHVCVLIQIYAEVIYNGGEDE